MAVNGKGKGLRWFLYHRDEGWTICVERRMLRATARGPGGNLGILMLQGVEQEQQLERKKSIQVGAKRGAETSLEKGKKEKGSN